MQDETADIAIVGAGAAGLMAGIWAGRIAQRNKTSLRILLLDSRPKIGAKILMSGGTRCNVTNKEVKPSDYQGGPRHFIKHVLEAFTPGETIAFFDEIGVKLLLEPTGKYFPVTHSAQTVLNALIAQAEHSGVSLKTGTRITQILKKEGRFFLRSHVGEHSIFARSVILTTGGLSYPTTGSDGGGYQIAANLGHKIVDCFPALTPLLTNDADWKGLSGIALEVELAFFKNQKKSCAVRDALLFTHFGFSGPAALDISRHFAGSAQHERPQIFANFLPNYDEASLKTRFQKLQAKNPSKLVKNILAEDMGLPERFAKVFLKKIGMGDDVSLAQCPSEKRKKLMHLLLNYPLEISGVFGYKKAEVTAGGVDLQNVKVSTMESKIVQGLYLAGEILNVDGRIGGFNFQWAWSTGAIAGRSAAQHLLLSSHNG